MSGKLIHKEQLFQLERALKRQLFGRAEVELKILERYELSGQYTPEKLLELYKDSILWELRHYSILEYNLFRGAKISFPEEHIMRMELRKTTLGEDAADELIRVLYKIFTERCGLDVHIHTEFVEQEEEKKKRSGRADIDRQAALLAETMLELKAAQGSGGRRTGGEPGRGPGRRDDRRGAFRSREGGPKAAGGQKKEAAPKTGGKRAFGGLRTERVCLREASAQRGIAF